MAENRYWSLHNHSRYSITDALPDVQGIVTRASELGWPACGLTDHGTPAGNVQFYQACRKVGVEPFLGEEIYLIGDRFGLDRKHMHLTVAARSEEGYRNLVRLSNMAHGNHKYKPRVDFADLAELAAEGHTRGLVLGTGCRSGPVVRTLLQRGLEPATKVAKTLAQWFPDTYVELMNHGIDAEGLSDDEICRHLLAIANTVGLPYLITTDSHYLRPDDRELHDALKRLTTFKDDPDEGAFDGEGYWMPHQRELATYYEPDVLEGAIGYGWELAQRSKLRLPELENFQLKVPDVSKTGDPGYELEQRVYAALEARGLGNSKPHLRRLNDELPVVEASQMPGYLMFVAEITDFMTAGKIWFGARGSASGALVNYLLGITQSDPIEYGIRMDRFLSGDRTKPPDVDLDIENARRVEAEEFIARQWAVRKVSTYAEYSLKGDEGAEKGSLRVRFFSTMKKAGVDKPSWDNVPQYEKQMLYRLSDADLISQVGVHPAAYVVCPDESHAQTIPMVYIASSKRLVTAYDKDDVEALGYPKVDLLGQKSLTAARITCEMLAKKTGTPAEEIFETLPLNDRKTYQRIARGDTDGVFQFDGFTARKGAKRLKPSKLEDVIACMALFRTGMSEEAVNLYITRKHDKTAPRPKLHPDIAAEADLTYGVLVYQEQAVGVLRTIGMQPGELTAMLNAVKASGRKSIEKGRKVVEEHLPRIRQLAGARGWTEVDIQWVVEALLGYGAGYSFNRGHAVEYGKRAYKSAWLLEHEPLEFWTGMLIAYTGDDNEPLYLRALAKAGIAVLPPHVNSSEVTYSVDEQNGAIRMGFRQVAGIGESIAAELVEKAPYASLKDLAERVVAKKVTGARKLATGKPPSDCGGTVAALENAGALSGLE